MVNQVRIPEEVVRAIVAHVEAAYPEEGCGFLLGADAGDADGFSVDRARAQENRATGSRASAYRIAAEEVRRLGRSLQGTGREILGFYHSHPDRPGRPSEPDRAQAWPWFAYLIVPVRAGRATGVEAFEFDPTEQLFRTVPLLLTGRRAGGAARGAHRPVHGPTVEPAGG